MKQVRFGIIGTNYISDMFVVAMRDVENGVISAICSRTSEKAQSFASKYGIPHTFDNYDALIASGTIDAVYIATPNSTHKEIASFFLMRKIPVLCEKPLTVHGDEARELIRIAADNHVLLGDAIVPLYTPNFMNLAGHLHLCGLIHRADFVYSQYSPSWDAYKKDKRTPSFLPENGAGSLMALGVYEVAMILKLFGIPDEVTAKANLMESGVDKQVTAIFQYPEIQVSMYSARGVQTKNNCCIQGEDGTIYFSEPNRLSRVWFEHRLTGKVTDLRVNTKSEMSYEIADFIGCLQQGRTQSDLVPHDFSLQVMDTLTDMRRQIGLDFKTQR